MKLSPAASDLKHSIETFKAALSSDAPDWYTPIYQGWRYLKNNRIVRSCDEFRDPVAILDEEIRRASKLAAMPGEVADEGGRLTNPDGSDVDYNTWVRDAWEQHRGAIETAFVTFLDQVYVPMGGNKAL